MSINVTPDDVGAAAKTFFNCQSELNEAWDNLSSALDAQGGMAGDGDPANIFNTKYQRGLAAAWDGLAASILTLGGMSQGLTNTGNNYIKAEHASTANKTAAQPSLLQPEPIISGVYAVGERSARRQSYLRCQNRRRRHSRY
jgi:hypothetical protein